MFKLFLNGKEIENVMLDNDKDLREYLENKYWIKGLYPTYMWAGKSR